MIKVRANIKLYKGDNKRQSAFRSGYRPLFNFLEKAKTSGQINLIRLEQFEPGKEGVVEITFLHKEYLGDDFGIGTFFKFYESKEPLGEGMVLEIL